MGERRPALDPASWAGFVPNGLGEVKPRHYLEMGRIAWENRRELGYAWRILNNGVCDGCALGTTGMRDFTLDGTHLCLVRLNLLKLNTQGPLDMRLARDAERLARRTSGELRHLGRIPYPMIRRKGDRGFTRVRWEEALAVAGERIRRTAPERLGLYLTSRGITNEVYYVAQKAARFLGTNNVDNSARICHSPSTVALKETLGVTASTCSYADWLGTDLLVFLGSDVANNQPVTTKYIYYAKKQGARVVVVNPYREPGMERYWIPSVFESAVFGTKIADDFYTVHHGGDLAFLHGAMKQLYEQGAVAKDFLANHVEDHEALREILEGESYESLAAQSGATPDDMARFARTLAEARSAVFVWSMGITQHTTGVENVKAIAQLALLRGFVGREKCGLMPIRGHSGVQGGAEVGAVPTQYGAGAPVGDEAAARMERLWGWRPPTAPGLDAVQILDAAHAGELDVLYSIGGNFLETLPDPDRARESVARAALRIHQDIVLTSQMLVDPADTVLVLPAMTRYEQPGGGTETSTERRIYFSPEIPGRRIGEARAEWWIAQEIAAATYPERADAIRFRDAQAIRDEIARAVPLYAGIETLRAKGDAVQWGGSRLCEGGRFETPTGRARMRPVAATAPSAPATGGTLRLSTRRGKQFNSMIQAERDALTGLRREDVLVASEDAERLGIPEGAWVTLASDHGAMRARVVTGPIRPGNLQVHWPEGNVLLPHGRREPLSGIPDYNVLVRVERA